MKSVLLQLSWQDITKACTSTVYSLAGGGVRIRTSFMSVRDWSRAWENLTALVLGSELNAEVPKTISSARGL